MFDRTEELELLLREKEELVEALTERLEQAAEQLDRLQRTNGDRGRWMSGGVPAELVEQQRELCTDLEQVVRQWEEMQCGAALGRIEMQLEELRDLVVRRPLAPASHAPAASEPPRRQAEPSDESQPPTNSSWEALKAGLLAQNGHAGPQQPEYAPAAHDEPVEDLFDGESVAMPEAVDFEVAHRDELRQAIESRDELIVDLVRRLRAAEARTRPSDDWRRLEATPAEYRARLESLERRLEQTLRLTEVELSVERARLGREAVRLKQLEEAAQRTIDRLGIASARDDDDDPDAEPSGQANTRWLRMLGIKRDA